MAETYRLSPKVKLIWSMEYIIGIIVLWIILSIVYSVFFPGLTFLLISPGFPILSYFFILLILIVIIGIPAYTWVEIGYRNFSYTLDENEVLIRTGVLHKRRVDIPYASIENVSVEKPLYERFFGLGTVVLDTAGGDAKEGVIPGVADTEMLMGEILKRMANAKGKGKKQDSKIAEDTIHVLKDILTELKDIKDTFKQTTAEQTKKSVNLMDIEEFEQIFKEQVSKSKKVKKKKK